VLALNPKTKVSPRFFKRFNGISKPNDLKRMTNPFLADG